jgi:hypothetical protein
VLLTVTVRLVTILAAFGSKVKLQNTFSRKDRGGILEVVHSSGKPVAALANGEFNDLNTQNLILQIRLFDSIQLRSSLNVELRRNYGDPISLGSGGVVTGAASVSESYRGIEPESSAVAISEKYFRYHGRKVCEMKNQLGNYSCSIVFKYFCMDCCKILV